MISDILVLLDRTSERAGLFAQSLASRFDAFITGVSIAALAPFEPVSYSEMGYDFAARAGQEEIELSWAALQRFEQNAKRMSLRAETLNARGGEQNLIALSHTYDLLVFEQRDPKRTKLSDAYIEPLLLKSGRPCLILPISEQVSPALGRLLWHGTAARVRRARLPMRGPS
jgi:hypothetical protein